VPVFLSLSMMIILNFLSISSGTFGLGAVGLFGGAVYFDEVLIGFISSVSGVFVAWRIIIKKRYISRRLEEISFAAVTSILFEACLLVYTAYYPFELFGLLQFKQPILVITWTFATTLIGCSLGFLLGGVVIKRMERRSTPATQPEEQE
jgi:hypothetical protein